MPRTAKDCEGCEYFNITFGLDEQTHFLCYRPDTLDSSAVVDDLADLDRCPMGFVRSFSDFVEWFTDMVYAETSKQRDWLRGDVKHGVEIMLNSKEMCRRLFELSIGRGVLPFMKSMAAQAILMGFSSFTSYAETMNGAAETLSGIEDKQP